MGTKAMPEVDRTLSDRAVPRPRALVSDVYNAILDRITGLEIEPGARITVDTLARELGVSQTPVREALSRLEAEGLVLKTHLIGHRALPQLTRAQVEQLFELRLLIEPAGAAMAARHTRRSGAGRAGSPPCGDGRPSGRPAPTYSEFARKDAEFHATIAQASGNAFLADALARLRTHVHIFRLVSHVRVTAEAICEHTELLAALAAGRRGREQEVDAGAHPRFARTRADAPAVLARIAAAALLCGRCGKRDGQSDARLRRRGDRRRRRRHDVRGDGRAARAPRTARRALRHRRREDPHLRRRPLQLHQRQRRPRRTTCRRIRTSAGPRWRATRPRISCALVESYGIAWHEKKLGQLFCDETALRDRRDAEGRVRARQRAVAHAMRGDRCHARGGRASSSRPRKATCAARRW